MKRLRDLSLLPTLLLLAISASEVYGAKALIYCSEGSPSTFNPQIATDGTTFNNTRAVYNQLVQFKYGETEIIPGLAESWVISDDGLKYTFQLRKGVKFHKTKYFTPTRDLTPTTCCFPSIDNCKNHTPTTLLMADHMSTSVVWEWIKSSLR